MKREPPEQRDAAEAPRADASDTAEEDTAAILSRRAFLIKSALAGAGVAATACGPKESPRPCLSVAPVRQDASARPCLKIAAPQDGGVSKPAPRPCLGPPLPARDGGVTKPAPHPCLSVPAPRPCLKVKPRRRPAGRICLSDFSIEGQVVRPKKSK